MNSHVRQHLAVQLNRSPLQAVHEHAVGHAMLTRSSIDTCNPEGAEHALLVAAIAVCVLASTHDRLLGDTVDVIAAAAETLGSDDDFLMAGPCSDPTFYSRHVMLLSFSLGLCVRHHCANGLQ